MNEQLLRNALKILKRFKKTSQIIPKVFSGSQWNSGFFLGFYSLFGPNQRISEKSSPHFSQISHLPEIFLCIYYEKLQKICFLD